MQFVQVTYDNVAQILTWVCMWFTWTWVLRKKDVCGEAFYCAAYGRSCVFGPSRRGDMNCLYRDVRVPRRRALGPALANLLSVSWRLCDVAARRPRPPRSKTPALLLFMPKMFWQKVWSWVLGPAE
jgi:hypothetical protein